MVGEFLSNNYPRCIEISSDVPLDNFLSGTIKQTVCQTPIDSRQNKRIMNYTAKIKGNQLVLMIILLKKTLSKLKINKMFKACLFHILIHLKPNVIECCFLFYFVMMKILDKIKVKEVQKPPCLCCRS